MIISAHLQQGHQFEELVSGFGRATTSQAKRGLVACPQCSSVKVEKAIVRAAACPPPQKGAHGHPGACGTAEPSRRLYRQHLRPWLNDFATGTGV
jgi:hypothetical protein